MTENLVVSHECDLGLPVATVSAPVHVQFLQPWSALIRLHLAPEVPNPDNEDAPPTRSGAKSVVPIMTSVSAAGWFQQYVS